MTDLTISRIVIACDAVGENRSAIETAARLASWWHLSLYGVFIEDESLLNLAALPFARHIGPGDEAGRELDSATILHQFEAHANRARRALELAAREHDLGWSFHVIRGQPTLETLPLGERDLLVIEAASRPFVRDFRLESRWLAAALQSHHPILLVRNPGRRTDGIVALLQGCGPSAERVIAIATRLADAASRALTILLADGSPDRQSVLAQIRALSAKIAARCRIEAGGTVMKTALRQTAGAGSLIVIDADPATNDTAALKEVMARTQGDILFLR